LRRRSAAGPGQIHRRRFARGQIAFAGRGGQGTANGDEGCISGLMAMVVVNRFEPSRSSRISDRGGVALAKLLGEELFKADAVAQRGERVSVDLRQQFLVLRGQHFGLLLGAEHQIDQGLIGFSEDGGEIDSASIEISTAGLLATLSCDQGQQLVARRDREGELGFADFSYIVDGRRSSHR